MSFKKILIIKGEYNSFEKYYLKNMRMENCSTLSYYNDRKNFSTIRKLWIHLGLPYEQIWYNTWKNDIDIYDIIIVFDSIVNSKIIKYIDKYRKRNSRLIFWHWNTINTDLLKRNYESTKTICEHWTFDPYDSVKYNMNLNNQFFFKKGFICNKIKWDIYFIGSDKGRYLKLEGIKKKLSNLNIKANIEVLRDKTSLEKGDLYINNHKRYEEILEDIKSCKCILELCQEGQEGLTARALESIFLGKKLITNNKSIKKEVFYDESNILLLEDGWEEKVECFIKKPYKNVDDEILKRYSFEGWIDGFIK